MNVIKERTCSKVYSCEELKTKGDNIVEIHQAARRISTIIYTMLKNSESIDELKMVYTTEYRNMQAEALDSALANEKLA